MEERRVRICPACGTEIKENDAVKVCQYCGYAYHDACWQRSGGCVIPGCPGQGKGEQPGAPGEVCANCGEPLAEGQAFCARCGMPRAPKKRTCGNCGAELADGQSFCARCGQPADAPADPAPAAPPVQPNPYEQPPRYEQPAPYEQPPRYEQPAPAPEKPKKKKTAAVVLSIVGGVLVLAAIALVLLLMPRKPSSITLSETAKSIDAGEKFTLKYTVEPEKVKEYSVTWSSDNEKVATVSNGIVTAKEPGVCNITVETDNGKTSSCKVTVTKPEVKKITLLQSSITIAKGDSFTLSYTVEPAKAKDYTVTWSSDNSSVASVANGVVKGEAVGTCNITVTTDNGQKSTCTVTVTMSEAEQKVVGTWRATSVLDFDTFESTDCSSYGWTLYIYDDNTGKFYLDSDSEASFVWMFSNVNDYDNDVYLTSMDGLYFIYAREYGEIWLYLKGTDINVCITCEK